MHTLPLGISFIIELMCEEMKIREIRRLSMRPHRRVVYCFFSGIQVHCLLHKGQWLLQLLVCCQVHLRYQLASSTFHGRILDIPVVGYRPPGIADIRASMYIGSISYIFWISCSQLCLEALLDTVSRYSSGDPTGCTSEEVSGL